MQTLTLEWHEGSQTRSQVLFDTKRHSESVLIGRDGDKCDVVLQDESKTVSRTHAEIIFNRSEEQFYLLNRTRERDTPNPIIVDGRKVVSQFVPLKAGSIIQLGKVSLQVKSIDQRKPIYGLKCHVCQHISPHSDLSLACRWCGTTLAAAQSVYVE